MITSLNWLKKHINITSSLNIIEEGLTALGLECKIIKQNYSFENVVIGIIKECKKHPNADKLSICEVVVGENKNLQIICGAPNVKKDLKVAVATVGAKLDNGQFKIKKTKIRGEISRGMICSERELGIGQNHDGILELDTDLPLGTTFDKFLENEKDILLNFELTPNRGDCFSHIGIAREIAILENSKIKSNNIKIVESKELTKDNVSIHIDDLTACSKYTARIIKGIKVGPSPNWLKLSIESVGLKSVNNIVDAANYVMLDTGQPMHTFDLNNIEGQEIHVRFAKEKEKITLLDGNKVKLKKHHLLITDKVKPIALAGVMGSLDSAISPETTDILIESAYFMPTVIRKSSKSLDLLTDASKRFERNIDFNEIEKSSKLLANLIQEVAGGEILKESVNIGSEIKIPTKVDFNPDKCNKFLGTQLSTNEFENIFYLLNISFKMKDKKYNCLIPSYRNDLSREVDLYEEIARVYGYDNIIEEKVFKSNYGSFFEDKQKSFNYFLSIASSNGFLEHYSNSLVSKENINLFSNDKSIELSNPISSEMSHLRNSLLPGLLNAVAKNEKRQQSCFKLIEIGQVHARVEKVETTSVENTNFGLMWYDSENPHWRTINKLDVYNAKKDLYMVLSKMGCYHLKEKEVKYPGFSLSIEIKNKKSKIGILGIISDKISKIFNIDNQVIAFEGNLQKIRSIYENKTIKYLPVSLYPSVTRDIAIMVNNNVQFIDLKSTIKQVSGEILNSIVLFDLYESKDLGRNKKSMAFKLKFQSHTKTFTDKFIDTTIDKIINSLEKKYGAIQR